MTTLSAKADSFSGHAFGTPMRFVPKAQPEPQYVPCGVNVSVGNVATRAAMRPIRELLLNLWKNTTLTTRLRGVLRVNRYNPYPSFLRFGYEDVYELCPTSIMRRLRQSSPRDTFDVKSFVGYQGVRVNQLTRRLVVKVSALVGNLLMQTSYTLSSLTSPGRTLDAPRERPRSPSKPLLGFPVVLGRGDAFAAICDDEALQPEVYTNRHTVTGRLGCVPEVARKDRVPFTALPLDRNGLNDPFDRPMQLDLDVADILKVQASVLFELTAVAIGRELNRSEPIFRLVSRVTWSVACLASAKERLERLIQPPQRRLGRREVESREARTSLAGRLKPPRLFTVGDGAFFGFVHVPTFSQSKVVQSAVLLKHRIKGLLLRAVREQPKLVCFPHLGLAPCLLSGDVAGYRLIRNVPGGAHVVGPAPQSRHTALEMPVSFPKDARRVAFELVCKFGRGQLRRSLDKEVYVIRLYRKMLDLHIKLGCLLSDKSIKVFGNPINQHGEAILRAPYKVIVQVANTARCMPKLHIRSIPEMLSKNNVYNAEGGAPDFLCRLKTTVPVR